MISYLSVIQSKSLSLIVFEIFGTETPICLSMGHVNFHPCRGQEMSNRQNIKKASGTQRVLRLCKVPDPCSQACPKNVGHRQTHTQTDTQTDGADNMIVAPFEKGQL